MNNAGWYCGSIRMSRPIKMPLWERGIRWLDLVHFLV